MKIRINRASLWNSNNKPCEKAELKNVIYYDKRQMTMDDLKQDRYKYNAFMEEGQNHHEEYDKFNKPWCVRELKRNIWVLTVRSLNALDDLIDEVGQIIIEPENSYKGIDYHIIIYDDYIE